MHAALRPFYALLENVFLFFFHLIQRVIVLVFAPRKPASAHPSVLKNGRIAVIGAGLSGISAAAHAVAHGWDVTIFEQKDHVGGIWSEVNETSGLQLNSLMYRFFPDIVWSKNYPEQREIVANIERIWTEYKLKEKTRFNTEVKSIKRVGKKNDDDVAPSIWIINDNEQEKYDAVIGTIGTCGKPVLIPIEGDDKFKGKIAHSSDLDSLDVKGKRVVVIGGGASAVEAGLLSAEKGAAHTEVLVRHDKWIIPRNFFAEAILSMFPGREIFLSHLPEYILRKLFYRELEPFAPKVGIHTATPIVNSDFLERIRAGQITYRHGETIRVNEHDILFGQKDSSDQYILKARGPKTPKDIAQRARTNGGRGNFHLDADVIIMATGFEHPIAVQKFVPKEFMAEPFAPPNMYMQVFSVNDYSLLMLNATYRNAVGTVGHIHLGIYTRILLTFLGDPTTAPYPELMRVWVRFINTWKNEDPKSRTAMTFITYFEMMLWFGGFFLFNPFRIKYLPFVLFGWRSPHLQAVASKREDAFRKMQK